MPLAFETSSPSAFVIVVSRYAIWRARRIDLAAHRELVAGAAADRIVEYVIEIVAPRSPFSSAAFVAKFIAASCTTA